MSDAIEDEAPEAAVPPDIELPTWDDARSRVFIALRSLGFFHALDADSVLAQRSLPLLVEGVALDLGGAITYVSAEAVEAWGITPDALFEAARRNVLAGLEHQLEPIEEHDPPRLFRCSSGDAFESSRLVSLPLLVQVRETLEAEILVLAAPDRDTLLVARDPSPEVLLRMADLAEATFRESPRAISPALYLLTAEGDLGPLELVEDHPLRERVRRGHLLLADAEYAAQKEALDARLAAQGVDLFVATHFAVERASGPAFSYTTWAEGAEALLPCVDVVVFGFADPERPPLLVPWEVALGLVPDLWEEVPQLEPVRRRTLGFPSDEQLAALADYALSM